MARRLELTSINNLAMFQVDHRRPLGFWVRQRLERQVVAMAMAIQGRAVRVTGAAFRRSHTLQLRAPMRTPHLQEMISVSQEPGDRRGDRRTSARACPDLESAPGPHETLDARRNEHDTNNDFGGRKQCRLERCCTTTSWTLFELAAILDLFDFSFSFYQLLAPKVGLKALIFLGRLLLARCFLSYASPLFSSLFYVLFIPQSIPAIVIRRIITLTYSLKCSGGVLFYSRSSIRNAFYRSINRLC